MKRLLTASILAASLASGAAFAQSPGVGPYVGASAGWSNYSADCEGVSCDKSDFGFKLFGGYMFTPYIGAEVQYADYGKLTVSDAGDSGDLQASGVGAFLIGQYPVDNFRVFGRIGFAYVDAEISAFGISISDSKTNFAWGVGATYMFNKNLGVRAEYEQTKYQLEVLGEELKDNVGLWSIGVQYTF